MMDINYFRGLITAVTLLAFIGIWVWAWSKKRKKDFDESARLPLEEHRRPPNVSQENS